MDDFYVHMDMTRKNKEELTEKLTTCKDWLTVLFDYL